MGVLIPGYGLLTMPKASQIQVTLCEEAIQQMSFQEYRLHGFNTQQRTRGSRRLVVYSQ